MKTLVAATFLLAALPSFAASQVFVTESFATITGAAAKEMYHALNIEAKVDLEGEAGDDVLFKDGKTFRCHHSTSTQYYACDVFLTR
ncbi:MAG: hypothetical protein ACLGG7_12880 [Bacteriovoracia bacterium]